MNWPPNKAWTSNSLKDGFRHFQTIGFGGKSKGRWVLLSPVLNGSKTLKVHWSELKDSSNWISGWQQLPQDTSFEQ